MQTNEPNQDAAPASARDNNLVLGAARPSEEIVPPPANGYAAPPELPQASETGTGAGGGVGGVRDEWNDAKNQWTFAKDIVGAFAMWACRQSPYGVPDNLGHVCCVLRDGLKTAVPWDANGMAELSLSQIEAAMRGILYEKDVTEFNAWNERRNGRDGIGFCSRYDEPAPDDDFIDLDALLRNVCITIRDERRQDRAFDERFEREEAGRAAGAGVGLEPPTTEARHTVGDEPRIPAEKTP